MESTTRKNVTQPTLLTPIEEMYPTSLTGSDTTLLPQQEEEKISSANGKLP